jgi:hypothetical protein
MRSRSRLWGWAAALALLAPAPVARAADPSPAKARIDELSTVVLLLDARDGTTSSAVTQAVRAQLSDLPVTLVPVSENVPGDLGASMRLAARVAEQRGGQAVFWLEVGANGSVLYFLGQPFNELLSRRLGDAGARAEAIDEEVSVIVRSTVVALLQNEKVDMAPVEPPSPPALEQKPPPPRRSEEPPPEKRNEPPPQKLPQERLRISVGYLGTSSSDEGGWENGVAFGISGFPWKRLLIGARYTVLLPVAVDTDIASLRIFRHPFEASVGNSFEFGRVALEPEVAGLVDYRTRSTTATSSEVEKTPDEGQFLFGGSARLRGVLRIFPAFSLFLAGGADFYAPPIAYVVRPPDGPDERLLTTRTVLSRVEAGLTLNPF